MAAALAACGPPSPPEAPAPSAPVEAASPGSAGGDTPALEAHADAPEPNPPVERAGADKEPDNADSELAPASTPANGPIDLDRGDDLDADIAELSETTKGGQLDPEPKNREIVYRVTPKGLVIEIDGLHLRPEAKSFKDKHGAYGVELVVKAESFDGRQYWVSHPKEGPFSIAGKIESKASKPARFSDQREAKGEELVRSGEPHTFRQRWPGKGQPKLWWGQTLTLEVGLWGFRTDAARERPVRRLFLVKMVGGNKPQPVLTPPTLDWGS